MENQDRVTDQQVLLSVFQNLFRLAIEQGQNRFVALREQIPLQRLDGLDVLAVANQVDAGLASVRNLSLFDRVVRRQLVVDDGFQVFQLDLKQIRLQLRH